MGTQNQHGQAVIEMALMLLLFCSMVTAIQFMSERQRVFSNKYKLSQSDYSEDKNGTVKN